MTRTSDLSSGLQHPHILTLHDSGDLLEEGYEDGAVAVVTSIFGTRLDHLRDHPRFIALAEKMGLSR